MLLEARRAKVPVCVHLDHGSDLEYVREALDIGFTGIMFDGSTLPYEENLAITKQAVAMSHVKGASVEAELGSMGRREMGTGEGGSSGVDDETKIYTDPALAKEFIDATGIDALACSFGTTHGIYLKAPRLDFDVVRNVRAASGGIPVVMHGGSGVSREDFHKAIRAGVRKINYFTYMDKAAGSAAAAELAATPENAPVFFTKLAAAARTAMVENLREAMKTFAMIDD